MIVNERFEIATDDERVEQLFVNDREMLHGIVEPMVWLYECDDRYRHAFLFRKPVQLPAGTLIHGVPPTATVTLLTMEKKKD